jgi:hypothetical protein
MRLDTSSQQAMAFGIAYGIALLERAPAHWIRQYDLHALLEKLMGRRARARAQGGAQPRTQTADGAPPELH